MMDKGRYDDKSFEDRLRSVAPAAPSAELRERIAQRLDTPGDLPDTEARWRIGPALLAAAGLAVAACVVIAVWLAVSGSANHTPPGEVLVEDDTLVPAPRVADPLDNASDPSDSHSPVDPVGPDFPADTLLAFHRALRQSPSAALTVFETQTVSTHDNATPRGRTLRAMDTAMFLLDEERCDG